MIIVVKFMLLKAIKKEGENNYLFRRQIVSVDRQSCRLKGHNNHLGIKLVSQQNELFHFSKAGGCEIT
jgi:hypothetical protein